MVLLKTAGEVMMSVMQFLSSPLKTQLSSQKTSLVALLVLMFSGVCSVERQGRSEMAEIE